MHIVCLTRIPALTKPADLLELVNQNPNKLCVSIIQR